MNKTLLLIAGFAWIALNQEVALAQQNDDPNLKHFFHGRRQITITDDSPIINDKRTGITDSGKPSESLFARPGLPKSGWESYTPAEEPTSDRSLPKTNNGVPPKQVRSAVGQKGKAGLLHNKAHLAGQNHKIASDPNQVKTYKPYAIYANPNMPAATAAASSKTSANVHGHLLNQQSAAPQAPPRSALHWARGN